MFYQDFRRLAPVGQALESDEVFAYFIVHYLPTGVLGPGDRGDLLGGDGHARRAR